MEPIEIEIFICMNESGEYETGKTEEEVLERYEEQIGGNGVRTVFKKTLKVPPPKSVVEL